MMTNAIITVVTLLIHWCYTECTHIFDPTTFTTTFYFADVCRGLDWLHHKAIIHRDLKTANITHILSQQTSTNIHTLTNTHFYSQLDVCRGLNWRCLLHHKAIVHRDLKRANINTTVTPLLHHFNVSVTPL